MALLPWRGAHLAAIIKKSQSNTIATLLAICIAVAVYGLVMLLIKGIVEEDLQTVPGGGKLIRVCRRLHLL